MIDNPTEPEEQPKSARALSSSPMVPSCPICGAALQGKQKACSGKCRAALSRRRKAEAETRREQRWRDLVGLLAKEAGLRPEDFD
jgi:predicted nucleic acid-binding Zn ribbon protein